MKLNPSLESAQRQLSRRDFLKILGGAAGTLVMGPRWTFSRAGTSLSVPPTLMLHTKDRWKLEAILKWLADHGYQSVTYRTLAQVMADQAVLPAKPVILTLDDVGSDYIQPYFFPMLDLIEKANQMGMLGVVTRRTPKEKPDVWKTLAEFASRGWQLETHTSRHLLLPALDDVTLHAEVVDSVKMLEDGTSQHPTSLIVPYANLRKYHGGEDKRIFAVAGEAALRFVVGMAGGRAINGGMAPYYLGRIGIGHDAIQTGGWIESFHNGITTASE